jgi:hypothetical protein
MPSSTILNVCIPSARSPHKLVARQKGSHPPFSRRFGVPLPQCDFCAYFFPCVLWLLACVGDCQLFQEMQYEYFGVEWCEGNTTLNIGRFIVKLTLYLHHDMRLHLSRAMFNGLQASEGSIGAEV